MDAFVVRTGRAPPPSKRERDEPATNAEASSEKKRARLSDRDCNSDGEEQTDAVVVQSPHLRAWRAVQDNSLFFLDARPESTTAHEGGSIAAAKIAAFDLDGTLIVTKSGKRFAKDAADWKLFHATNVTRKLKQLVRDGFQLVILSNQNGVAKGKTTEADVQTKMEAIVRKLDVPMMVLFATQDDQMRKPRTGAWQWLVQELHAELPIDTAASFYCGDAAGRPKITGRNKDFAATDYKFALNAGLQFYTPEALFLDSSQRIHTRADMWEMGFDPRSAIKKGDAQEGEGTPSLVQAAQELVVLVGPPASGKSHLAHHAFVQASSGLPAYEVVSQDQLKTLSKCKAGCIAALAKGKSVIVDNTNPDRRTRSEWVKLAKEKNVPIRCIELAVDKPLSLHLNTFRKLTSSKSVPDIAIHTYFKYAEPPTIPINTRAPCHAITSTQLSHVTTHPELPLHGSQERQRVELSIGGMSSKLKDGLFMGDIDAAQDTDFLQLNGIVHIINCVPRQVPNLFEQSLGLTYTTCDLEEVLQRPFFDLKNREFMGLIQHIDRGLEKTESVLVHSLDGVNRSPSLMLGYLMVKYCWGVDKAHEFMLTKRADIKPHESYVDQLCTLESQLMTQYPTRASEQQLYEWHPSLADPKSDEIILIHTFLNCSAKAGAVTTIGVESEKSRNTQARKRLNDRRLTWIDQSMSMKKMYPSLMIKPERPPNHSYSEMRPANGWADLITPGNISIGNGANMVAGMGTMPVMTQPPRQVITAFVDGNSSKVSHPDPTDADIDSFDHQRQRVHSFSLPKQRNGSCKEINSGSVKGPRLSKETENRSSSSLSASPTTSDQDDIDSSISISSKAMATMAVKRRQQPPPRYQKSVGRVPGHTNGGGSGGGAYRQGKLSTRPDPYASTTTSFAHSASYGAGLSGQFSAFTPSSARRTSDGTNKPSRIGTSKHAPSTARSASMSSMSTSTRGLFAPEYGNSSNGAPVFSVRRVFAESTSSNASATSSNSSSTARPRTAPPRMRRKDSDTRDPLPLSSNKNVDSTRINGLPLGVRPSLDTSSSRRMSGATGLEYGVPSSSSGGNTSRGATVQSSRVYGSRAPARRPSTARAQWK